MLIRLILALFQKEPTSIIYILNFFNSLIYTSLQTVRQTEVVQFVTHKGVLSVNLSESVSKCVVKNSLLTTEMTHFHSARKKILSCGKLTNYQTDRKMEMLRSKLQIA